MSKQNKQSIQTNKITVKFNGNQLPGVIYPVNDNWQKAEEFLAFLDGEEFKAWETSIPSFNSPIPSFDIPDLSGWEAPAIDWERIDRETDIILAQWAEEVIDWDRIDRQAREELEKWIPD